MAANTDTIKDDVDATDDLDPVEKFPELRAQFTALQNEKAAMEERTAPVRAERGKLLESIRPTLAKIHELEREFMGIEQPRLAEIDNQLGALAKAMGGRALSAEGK